MSNSLRRILIMAGGTGGHVFPGLSVARYFKEQGVEVHWLGTAEGMEARLVPPAHIPFHLISISGLRGKGWQKILRLPVDLGTAVLQAVRILRKIKPDMVLGMGGFVSGPGGIAAGLLGYPLVIHEQNAIPGMTNQWLSFVAKKVLEGFPGTFKKRAKVVTVGNPIRLEMTSLPEPQLRFEPASASRRLRLLVLGGSLGARAINQVVPHALSHLSESERPEVLHQTGEKLFQETCNFYAEKGIKADIRPFLNQMNEAYAWADIVLARAGALTISELCAVGLGALLVPYPYAVDDHQTANANKMVQAGAALIIPQADLSAEDLAAHLKSLNQKKCLSMAQFAYKLRKIDATERVVKICEEICH